jgi:hypothetical protein
MKRYDPRLWIGGILIFLGALTLLDNLNIISNVSDIFWGIIWGLIGLYFLYRLLADRSSWWAAFPAFTLLGLSAAHLLPAALQGFSGLAFMGGIALAFLWVYFADTDRWWAIIPAGVMLTLGVLSTLNNVTGVDNGGLLFLGLGLTFILVAVLPGGRSRSWALIPGAIMLVFGAFLGTPFAGLTAYLWPAILIILGGYFVVRFFTSQSSS